MICGPSPPFSRPCFSILSTSVLHAWISFLGTTRKASLRAPAGLRGLYHPLPTFCAKDKCYYLHVISTSGTHALLEVLLVLSPGRSPCSEQGAELSLHCHAQHRVCAAALQLNSSLAKWWQGIILASPWRVFRLHPEHTSQIFPCSQDNFRDKGLFNSAKLWRLFYTMYNWQIFMWLTSEFKHTLVVQRCD